MKFWTSISILGALCVMIISSYFLHKELTSRIQKSGGEVIGTITFKKKSASRKYSESVVWEEIAAESPIYNYDSVRTLEYSSAVLSLKDGTRIELDEKTMLVVMLSAKGVDINFDRGGVSAKSGTGDKLITLNSRDATIALNSGDISVNSSDKGTDIALAAGSAKVEAGGKGVNITSDETATLKDGVVKAEKKRLFTEAPSHNAIMMTFGNIIPVSFSWRSEPAGEVSVEIATDGSFSRIVKSFTSRGRSQVVDMRPGDYYWRLVSGKNRSFPVKFSIFNDVRPEIITPAMNQRISLGEGGGLLTFRWERSRYASEYEIVIARDREMKDVYSKLTSKVNTISAADLDSGVYYCTARSIYPAGISSGESISGPNRFTVEKVQFSLARPGLIDPGPVTTAGPFTLYWKGVQGAERYTVEIASDAEFKKKVLMSDTQNTFLRVERRIDEGNYYWKVAAKRGRTSSGSSDIAPLIITKPVQITLVFPQTGTVLYNRPEVINFMWKDPNKGYKYLVEVSEKSDFSRLSMNLESDLQNVTGESPGAGSYYWRVVLKDKSGRIMVKSAPGEFSIPAQLRAPLLVTPKNNESIIPGIKNRIKFEWRKVASANEYEVEVFQRIAGAEKTMIVYTAKGGFVEASNISLYRPGKFSWLVRAKQVRNGKITAFRESDKSFFEIEDVQLLPPPEIKKPGILFK